VEIIRHTWWEIGPHWKVLHPELEAQRRIIFPRNSACTERPRWGEIFWFSGVLIVRFSTAVPMMVESILLFFNFSSVSDIRNFL